MMLVFSVVAVAFATPFTVQMKELLETPELRHADIGISVRRLTDASQSKTLPPTMPRPVTTSLYATRWLSAAEAPAEKPETEWCGSIS